MSESSWSPSPSAERLGTLQRQIAAYVLMPDDDEALETALAGIRRAIDKINTRNWNWALTYDDITFVADQGDYPLDSVFKAPRNFELDDVNGVSQDRLMYLPWQTLLKENPSIGTNGTPCHYSVANAHATGLLSLDVPPTIDWVNKYPTGRLWYYRRVQYPTVAGTAIDVPSEVIGFISSYAEGYTADRYAPEKAEMAYGRSVMAFKDIVRSDNDVQTDWE